MPHIYLLEKGLGPFDVARRLKEISSLILELNEQ
jgi:hypothetical protein